MIVAQISDLHIRRRGHVLHHMPNTADHLRRAIGRLHTLAARPSVVLATGDLTERGSAPEYARLRELLETLEIPYFLLPGNHDDRERLRAAFPEHRYLRTCARHASYAIDVGPMRIIALDSTAPNHVGGYFDTERLAWLDEELSSEPHRPTLLAMHHPPFRTGIGPIDVRGFLGDEALGHIVQRHRQIARIVCGHIHTAMQRAWNGAVACSAPSTSPQFVIGRSRLGIGIEAAGLLLHEWSQTLGVQTHLVRIGCGAQRRIA